MLRRIFYFSFAFGLFAGSIRAQEWNGYEPLSKEDIAVAAPEGAIPPKIGAVLLNGGLIIEGDTFLEGNTYHIKSGEKVTKFSKNLIEFTAEDVNEIYIYVKGKTDLNDFTQVLELAKWCNKNKLRKEALEEFDRVKSLALDTQSVKIVNETMRLCGLIIPDPPKNIEPESGKEPAARSLVPAHGNNVLQVGHIEADDFDYLAWEKTLSANIVTSYSKQIQPILLRRCGAANCHGPDSEQEFRLITIRPGESKLKTLRNLKHTMEFIDTKDPDKSGILTVADQPHGGLDPMLNKQTEANFINLYHWTHNSAPHVQKRLPLAKLAGGSGKTVAPAVADDRESAQISHASAWMPVESVSREKEKKSDSSEKRTRIKNEPPIDPYDPSVFNERYHPSR